MHTDRQWWCLSALQPASGFPICVSVEVGGDTTSWQLRSDPIPGQSAQTKSTQVGFVQEHISRTTSDTHPPHPQKISLNLPFLSIFQGKYRKGPENPKNLHMCSSFGIRPDFWEGDEDSNFSVFRVQQFTEWPGPLHLLNCLSYRNPYQTPHSLNCFPPFH